jgi:hypothetical protein
VAELRGTIARRNRIRCLCLWRPTLIAGLKTLDTERFSAYKSFESEKGKLWRLYRNQSE